MQGRIFGPKREEMAGGWGNLQRVSWLVFFAKYYLGGQMEYST
jgi:hypothetical protein